VWHELPVDEAVTWAAERTRFRITEPATTLRLGILVGDAELIERGLLGVLK
jgi:hypothetical protein